MIVAAAFLGATVVVLVIAIVIAVSVSSHVRSLRRENGLLRRELDERGRRG